MVTTTSITAVSVSILSDHADLSAPEVDPAQQLDALLLAVQRHLVEGEKESSAVISTSVVVMTSR